jgi:chromosome segregation ATPase
MKNICTSLLFAPRLLLSPDAASPGGGSSPKAETPAAPRTLAEALTALAAAQAAQATAASESATAQASVTSITAERDQIKAQFETATAAATAANTERDQARAELATAQASIGALTTDLAAANAAHAKASENVSRLEKLCGLKGIDPKAAVSSVESSEAASGDGAALAQQWADLRASGKFIEAAEFRKANQVALDAFAASAK